MERTARRDKDTAHVPQSARHGADISPETGGQHRNAQAGQVEGLGADPWAGWGQPAPQNPQASQVEGLAGAEAQKQETPAASGFWRLEAERGEQKKGRRVLFGADARVYQGEQFWAVLEGQEPILESTRDVNAQFAGGKAQPEGWQGPTRWQSELTAEAPGGTAVIGEHTQVRDGEPSKQTKPLPVEVVEPDLVFGPGESPTTIVDDFELDLREAAELVFDTAVVALNYLCDNLRHDSDLDVAPVEMESIFKKLIYKEVRKVIAGALVAAAPSVAPIVLSAIALIEQAQAKAAAAAAEAKHQRDVAEFQGKLLVELRDERLNCGRFASNVGEEAGSKRVELFDGESPAYANGDQAEFLKGLRESGAKARASAESLDIPYFVEAFSAAWINGHHTRPDVLVGATELESMDGVIEFDAVWDREREVVRNRSATLKGAGAAAVLTSLRGTNAAFEPTNLRVTKIINIEFWDEIKVGMLGARRQTNHMVAHFAPNNQCVRVEFREKLNSTHAEDVKQQLPRTTLMSNFLGMGPELEADG